MRQDGVLGVALVAMLAAALAHWPAAADDVTLNLIHDGRTREAVLYLPEGLPAGAPLVIVLHGGGGNWRGIRRIAGFDRLADEHGFAVAYPQATERQWNDGREPDAYRRGEADADDVGFFDKLIDAALAETRGDPARVYVTGASNGGMMSFRLACELAERIAAAAPVIANMPARLAEEGCRPARPVPILIMNGTADEAVPYEGGYVTVFGRRYGRVLSAAESAALWRDINGCAVPSGPTEVVDDRPFDGTNVVIERATDCRRDSAVVLVTIEGGGHGWPDKPSVLGRGRATREIAASEVIWEFLREYRLE